MTGGNLELLRGRLERSAHAYAASIDYRNKALSALMLLADWCSRADAEWREVAEDAALSAVAREAAARRSMDLHRWGAVAEGAYESLGGKRKGQNDAKADGSEDSSR